jgi:hypothetical protein
VTGSEEIRFWDTSDINNVRELKVKTEDQIDKGHHIRKMELFPDRKTLAVNASGHLYIYKLENRQRVRKTKIDTDYGIVVLCTDKLANSSLNDSRIHIQNSTGKEENTWHRGDETATALLYEMPDGALVRGNTADHINLIDTKDGKCYSKKLVEHGKFLPPKYSFENYACVGFPLEYLITAFLKARFGLTP